MPLSQAQAVATWKALGTTVNVAVTEARALEAARAAVRAELDAVDTACSRFREDSELALVNRRAGERVLVSPLLVKALRTALDAAVLSDGLVDPTVGEAVRATGYAVSFGEVPYEGPPILLLARPAPGWQRVELDDAAGVVCIPAGVSLDLGATAKALAADRAAAAAQRATGCGVLVECGGDIATAGAAPEAGWSVRVSDGLDEAEGGTAQGIGLCGGGLATSGTTVLRWVRGGVPLHHIVDPATGLPAAAHWRAVSVAAASCVDANVAATAAIILGTDAVAWLAERRLPSRLVGEGGITVRVGGWPAP